MRVRCPTCDESFTTEDDLPEGFAGDLDEIADLIVSGEAKAAYGRLRENFPDLPVFELRRQRVLDRGASPRSILVDEARHDAIHQALGDQARAAKAREAHGS